jgi:hypothetical protein
MTRRVLLAVAVVATLFRGPAAFACSCVSVPIRTQFKQAAVVFVGTATTVRSAEGEAVAVDFAVSALYKGRAPEHVSLTTPSSGSACGIAFLPNQRYTVFASRASASAALGASLCGGTTDDTRVLAKAGYVRPLQLFGEAGAPVAHPVGTSSSRGMAIGLAAVLLLAAAGTIWAGKRRKTVGVPG